MSSKKILITGSNGLLGQHLSTFYIHSDHELLATSNGSNRLSFLSQNYRELDITNFNELKNILAEFNPDVIINTAAATNVDSCEDYPDTCDDINHKGVENILRAFNELEINPHLIQISTDFIFDGEDKEYTEENKPNPINKYGLSKWKGEQVLLESEYKNFTIVRTSLVYGVGEALNKGNIFLWAMSKLREGEELSIVDDQFRTPTYVKDLCNACVTIAKRNINGIINVAGDKNLSMYDYIRKTAEYVGVNVDKVKAIPSEKLAQKAKRPYYSGLDIRKAKRLFNYTPTKFEDSLREMDALS